MKDLGNRAAVTKMIEEAREYAEAKQRILNFRIHTEEGEIPPTTAHQHVLNLLDIIENKDELAVTHSQRISDLCQKINTLNDKIAAYDKALEISAFDLAPCMECGELVFCLPDGLPICDPCGKKLEEEENGA